MSFFPSDRDPQTLMQFTPTLTKSDGDSAALAHPNNSFFRFGPVADTPHYSFFSPRNPEDLMGYPQPALSASFPADVPFVPDSFSASILPNIAAQRSQDMPANLSAAMPTAMSAGMPNGMPNGMPTAMPTAMPAGLSTGVPSNMTAGIPTSAAPSLSDLPAMSVASKAPKGTIKDAAPRIKRKPGRPKGSHNKNPGTRAKATRSRGKTIIDANGNVVKRRPGRPRKDEQLALATAALASAPTQGPDVAALPLDNLGLPPPAVKPVSMMAPTPLDIPAGNGESEALPPLGVAEFVAGNFPAEPAVSETPALSMDGEAKEKPAKSGKTARSKAAAKPAKTGKVTAKAAPKTKADAAASQQDSGELVSATTRRDA